SGAEPRGLPKRTSGVRALDGDHVQLGLKQGPFFSPSTCRLAEESVKPPREDHRLRSLEQQVTEFAEAGRRRQWLGGAIHSTGEFRVMNDRKTAAAGRPVLCGCEAVEAGQTKFAGHPAMQKTQRRMSGVLNHRNVAGRTKQPRDIGDLTEEVHDY